MSFRYIHTFSISGPNKLPRFRQWATENIPGVALSLPLMIPAAVNGQAMNVAHLPQNEFERNAVKALSEGQETYDETKDGVYQYVGMICLTNECLKCHVPNRKSTENRAAGIVITIPVKK